MAEGVSRRLGDWEFTKLTEVRISDPCIATYPALTLFYVLKADSFVPLPTVAFPSFPFA